MKMLEYYQIQGRVSSLSKMYLRIQKKKDSCIHNLCLHKTFLSQCNKFKVTSFTGPAYSTEFPAKINK